jgi:hypothetical protein
MKILILLMLCTNVQAGEIHWLTDGGMVSRFDCVLISHSHSDSLNFSEYWVKCDNEIITPINNGIINGKSSITFSNNTILLCPMLNSIFGSDDQSFYALMDCRTIIFKNKFDL